MSNQAPFLKNKELNEAEFLTGKFILKSKPIWMQLEVTTLCNLHCRMCRTKEDNVRYHTFIDPKVVDNLYKSGWFKYLQLLELNGGGETFLHPRIEELLNKFRGFKNLKIQITTNGLLLGSNKLLSFLCKFPNINLIFSIDSANSADYEKIRRGASRAILINNLNKLNDIRKMKKTKLTTECHCLVNQLNVGNLKDMVDFALAYRFKSLAFIRLHHCAALEVSDGAALPAMRDAVQYARSKNLPCSHYEKLKMDNVISKVGVTGMWWRCIRPWEHIMITANGDIAPCCYMAYRNKVFVMGNIKEQILPEIWNSEAYIRLRKSAFSGFPEFCNTKQRGCKSKTRFIPNVEMPAKKSS